ncbi:MAG TPA: hypothetical protein VK307_07340 [Thermoleophilaceae bacterium]|nr:hypothetical protein [Thermoleophilaceae bacterium]
MTHSIAARRTLAACLAAGSLAAALPMAADAASPRAGYWAGTTLQPAADAATQPYAGSVDFKVFKYTSSTGPKRKLLRIGAATQLRCASGEVKEDSFLVYVITGGKISSLGRFRYAGTGFTIRGRFTSKTSAKGTLSRTVGDCTVENVSWTAKRGSQAGIPIPTS